MKILVYIFSAIGLLAVVIILIGLLAAPKLNYEKVIIRTNFDNTYHIDNSNPKCQNLSYPFKVSFATAFDKMENTGPIHRSNCKLVDGRYRGYIYPMNKPEYRIHWQESGSGEAQLLKE